MKRSKRKALPSNKLGRMDATTLLKFRYLPNATVQDDITRTHWKQPYAAIVADPAQRTEQAPQVPPRRTDVAAFKLGDTVSFTDKHLRERIGTITRMNIKTYSLLCDGEQWRVSPELLRKIIDL